jgi:branched-subunit amino acid aminotransferase/4-amino-4-deoxychorismate lyase
VATDIQILSKTLSTMTEPVAWLNGQIVPISEAKLHVFDQGLVLGASITEMIRTFAHTPFHLDDHLDRLYRSLQAVGFPPVLAPKELKSVVLDVVDHNQRHIPAGHDLGIIAFVTAGHNLTYLGMTGVEQSRTPTVCVHTFPLPFELWADKCDDGQHLVTPSIRHIPPESLDPKIKSRSRLNWYLADQQARLVDSSAGALVLDRDGNITETSTANFFLVSNGTILTPSPRIALGGVSQKVVLELAAKLGIPSVAADLQIYDALNAHEAFTSSTPYCMLPVTRINGCQIGTGRRGPIFDRLVAAWNDLAGLDIIGQIRKGAVDRTRKP